MKTPKHSLPSRPRRRLLAGLLALPAVLALSTPSFAAPPTSEVNTSGLPAGVELHLSAFEVRQFCVKTRELLGFCFFQLGKQLRWNQGREMRRAFLLFPARESPCRTLQDAIQCIVVGH